MKITSVIKISNEGLKEYGDNQSFKDSIINKLAFEIAKEILKNENYFKMKLTTPEDDIICHTEGEYIAKKLKQDHLKFTNTSEYEMIIDINEIFPQDDNMYNKLK